MRHIRVLFMLFLILALLPGCSSTTEQQERIESTGIIIEGIVIRNELAYAATDVMAEVPATGGFAGCGNILARTDCSTTFQEVDYQANALVIKWKEHGEPQQTGPFVVKVPDHLIPGRPAWLEVIIFAPGQAGARLVQP